MVELVDTQDLKSCDHCGRAGSIPARGTLSKFAKSGETRFLHFIITTVKFAVNIMLFAIKKVTVVLT